MLALKRDIEALKECAQHKAFVHVHAGDGNVIQLRAPGFTRVYEPVPTLKKLHEEIGDYDIIGVMGAYGSGKSVGAQMQCLLTAMKMMPPCKDGVRRAKVACIRNTYEELKNTTYEMFLEWFSEIGSIKSTVKPLRILMSFNDDEGEVEIHFQFVALDKPSQYRKLRSSFYTFAYINEVSESPEGILTQVLGRTGRYPSLDRLDLTKVKHWYEKTIKNSKGEDEVVRNPYWSGVLFDTNPPEVDSELYKLFEEKKPKTLKLFKQPPGLIKGEHGWYPNPLAENIERLGMNYYAQHIGVATEEFIKVFCCGEYGALKTGEVIFPDYNDDIHSKDNLEVLEEVGLRLSFDTWYTPACTVSQFAMQQMRVLAAMHEEHMTIEVFAQEVVKPFLTQHYPNIPVTHVTFDPAGMAGEKVQGATSDFSQLKRAFGNIVKPAYTNQLKPRIAAVTHFLRKLSRGQPAFILDRKYAAILRSGFLKNYVWEETSKGDVIGKPKKNFASHPQDALQYEALQLAPRMEDLVRKSIPGTSIAPVRSIVRNEAYAR